MNQPERPIWTDKATGLPMHSHEIAKNNKIDGMIYISYDIEPAKPCSCRNKAYDIPEQKRRIQ